MLKLSKMTDYTIVLLSFLSKNAERSFSASSLAAATSIPEPTTSKLLKTLAANGLLISKRGVNGGYQAIGDYADISLTQIIEIIDGQIAMTDCARNAAHECSIKEQCQLEGCWDEVNSVIYHALNDIKLPRIMNRTKFAEASRDVI